MRTAQPVAVSPRSHPGDDFCRLRRVGSPSKSCDAIRMPPAARPSSFSRGRPAAWISGWRIGWHEGEDRSSGDPAAHAPCNPRPAEGRALVGAPTGEQSIMSANERFARASVCSRSFPNARGSIDSPISSAIDTNFRAWLTASLHGALGCWCSLRTIGEPMSPPACRVSSQACLVGAPESSELVALALVRRRRCASRSDGAGVRSRCMNDSSIPGKWRLSTREKKHVRCVWCVCVFVCVRVRVRVCVCARARARACACACVRARMRACMRECVHACVRACMRECVHACVHACVRVCVCVCVCVCVRACVCVCV